ncbi:MAG: indole-3-glycerol phosphate synthase TrpC [Kofleriaceae bacterium]|nr:indole-3-glycerol phosphate synthase TrpC [Kofleriaceae bacterium]
MAPSILARILERKRQEVAHARAERPLAAVMRLAGRAAPPRSLTDAVHRDPGAPMRVIAEIKRASPSAGPIRPGADPAAIAREYAAAGAAAISVLTDVEFFDGDLGFLAQVRALPETAALPLLRKDFLIDEYQVVEARAAGADAVLLIVAALDDATLRDLLVAAHDLGLEALVEVHDEAEADRAVAAGAELIGVNHRDLATFTIDLSLTGRLAARLPARTVLVGESGIRGADDVARLAADGAHAVLVGEALMRAPSPGAALRALLGGPGPER